MKIEIVHASISENGTVNGKPGDQTGAEVCRRELYDRGWKKVARCKYSSLAIEMARQAVQAAENDLIGYSQGDRYSLIDYLEWEDLSDIEKVDEKCNCDCSSLITAILTVCDIPVNREMWTGSEANDLRETGFFDLLDYDGAHLLAGDILIAQGHTAIVVYAGEPLTDTEDPEYNPVAEFADLFSPDVAGVYYPNDWCNLRTGPGLDREVMSYGDRLLTLQCYGYYSLDKRGVVWLLVKNLRTNRVCWVSSNVVTKANHRGNTDE